MNNRTINHTKFDSFDQQAHQFYLQHGWVVLSNVLSHQQLSQMTHSWEQLTIEQAQNIGCEMDQYLRVICQWRDLWKYDPLFTTIQKPLASIAAASFELSGCQLLHDHVITKQHLVCNGEVPWHQDSMYWPVDRTGTSTWVPLQDTPVEFGCLEVADGSHLWGISKPVDFMKDGSYLPENQQSTALPVSKSDVVLLHSLTWHRSLPSKVANQIRRAYLALWIPQASGYYPANAPWHPVNAQVEVALGQSLNENEFPVYGNKSDGVGNCYENRHSGPTTKKGMFNAKDRIAKQIASLLNIQKTSSPHQTLGEMLAPADQRETLVKLMTQSQSQQTQHQISKLIDELWISAAAYEQTRARNVFSSAYQQWDELYEQYTAISS